MTMPEYNALVRAYNHEQKLIDYRMECIGMPLINGIRALDKSWGWEIGWASREEIGLPFLVMNSMKPVKKIGPAMAEYEEAMRFRLMNAQLGGKEV